MSKKKRKSKQTQVDGPLGAAASSTSSHKGKVSKQGVTKRGGRGTPVSGPDIDLSFHFQAGDNDSDAMNSSLNGVQLSDSQRSIPPGRSNLTKSTTSASLTQASGPSKQSAKSQKKLEYATRRKESKAIKTAIKAGKAPERDNIQVSENVLENVVASIKPAQAPVNEASEVRNGLTEGVDFISLNFDDEDDDKDDDEESTVDVEKPNVFANIAEKLGKFVEESTDLTKRKRDNVPESKGSRKRNRAISKHDPYPWLQGKSYLKEQEPARILHREIIDFISYVEPTEEEHRVRRFIISRVQKLVERKWPTASLHVFGSFDTKLYLPTSDIDLVVLSQEGQEVYEKPNHLRRLANWLVKARIAENIQVITSARVPIIKYVDSVTKINVDISFNKPSGLVAAAVVKGYIEKMPALRPLVIFVKHFLHMRGMNEVYLGGLGSYSIICMVISFLQRHPKVAPGQILQEENLGVLVVEFFELYGKRYNYDNVGISINGRGKYFDKSDRGWQRAGQSYLLSIEDPTDPDNDIAKSSFGILKVKSTFGGGHDFLVQRLYDVNDRIKARRRADIGLDSILSSVVSIDEEMREGRSFITSCFDLEEVQDEVREMKPGEGEIPESLLPDIANMTNERLPPKLSHAEFVAEDESDEDLIDNDGHSFVRPAGYTKPFSPADLDGLYANLNTTSAQSGQSSLEGPSVRNPIEMKRPADEIYLIESSDDENRASPSSKGQLQPIDLDSEEDNQGEDSKVEQVDKSVRNRYWEAKGKEEGSWIDRDSESDYGV